MLCWMMKGWEWEIVGKISLSVCLWKMKNEMFAEVNFGHLRRECPLMISWVIEVYLCQISPTFFWSAAVVKIHAISGLLLCFFYATAWFCGGSWHDTSGWFDQLEKQGHFTVVSQFQNPIISKGWFQIDLILPCWPGVFFPMLLWFLLGWGLSVGGQNDVKSIGGHWTGPTIWPIYSCWVDWCEQASFLSPCPSLLLSPFFDLLFWEGIC